MFELQINDAYNCMDCGQTIWTTVGVPHVCTMPMTAWNGPICGYCGARWLGTHDCPVLKMTTTQTITLSPGAFPKKVAAKPKRRS